MTSSTGLDSIWQPRKNIKPLASVHTHHPSTECNWKKQPFLGIFFKKLQCVFSIFTFSNWLFKPVQPWIFASLSFTWRGTVSIQPVCPKVLVKCKSSNIQHENVGEWFEFLRQIPFVNIAIKIVMLPKKIETPHSFIADDDPLFDI